MSEREFDVCGPLPTGVTVLEASAGTGKTYTIAALAARYVAEGVPLDKLLLVTFTRMATGELRDRVRERLVAVERGLEAAGEAQLGFDIDGSQDEIVRLLADAPPDEVARRRANLVQALGDFDAATIATTHGFCQEVLGGLGVVGDVERDVTFVEDVDDLLSEVVDDLYVRRFFRPGDPPLFDRAEAMKIARAAVEHPSRIEPAAAPEGSTAAMRYGLACRAIEELDDRKRRAGIITFDDLLTRLSTALRNPDAVRRLRERYGVVLVDEFQDTDPVQWEILRRAFGKDVTLVLIGDPKQAIYAFRGADVYAYLQAARTATTRETLRVNRRSDQALIDAYDALLGGTRLGHPEILYREVRAANPGSRLTGAPERAPLRVRLVERGTHDMALTAKGFAEKGSTRDHVARDVAADAVRLLSSQARVSGRRIEPDDVAVLVRTNHQAALVRDALADAGVPAVINGAGSVFNSAPARHWLRLLEAIERPTSSLRAHACALTPFLGWTAAQVASAGEEEWEQVHARLHRWAHVLRHEGVASLSERITLVEGLPRRVLAASNGERELTDLRHVGQLLHAAARTEQLGPAALTAWLRRRVADAERDTKAEEHSRRLESDDEAVQVLTIHRAKGLEFPVVYLPFLWESSPERKNEPVTYHDPELTVDVGLEGSDYFRHKRRHEAEQRGEELRLAYVALTRAQHQAVVWWAGSYDTRDSALTRLLFSRDEDGTVGPSGKKTPTDAEARKRFEALAAAAPGRIAVEEARLGMPATWSRAPDTAASLAALTFDRALDRGWRRTSYSDITAAAHDARVASEPEEPVVDDEPEEGGGPAGSELPLADAPVGTAFGTFVHRVLEETDFAAADLPAELAARVVETQARRPLDIGEPSLVVAGLRAAIETPLGDGLRLRDVTRADRLDELAFELPLAGGDEPTGELSPAAIAAVLREHLGAGDPLAGYARRLEDPALRPSVRGYLTGSIDLVMRTGGRYAIADYKTNWLGPPGEPLTAGHYRPAALVAEMEGSHYALQALLYTVALHRYLRWRVPGYSPDSHLGGVYYLFVRGMTGGGGVFAWHPPGRLVEALSEALA